MKRYKGLQVIPYHIECKKLHKEAERKKLIKKWLRSTPVYLRRWGRYNPTPSSRKHFDAKAPTDFRFLENTKECAVFFKKIRKAGKMNFQRYNIDMSDVLHIDFASTMMLSAIGEEMLDQGCNLSGNSPKRLECWKYLKDSGFYNKMFDKNGRRFPSVQDSEFITVERGQYKLTKEHYKAIRILIQHINQHLVGHETRKRIHNTIIKEICANSVEWSEAEKSQWTLGAKFESDKVIIIALDLGKGILEKLYIDHIQHFKNIITFKGDSDILFGAFEQKYGSTAMETNRNRGLPCVKAAIDEGHIKDLKVVTNNSIIDFDKKIKKEFARKRNSFKGTLYSWQIDKNCL